MELMDKKKFVKITLDENTKIFVIHVTVLEAMPIYFYRASQVESQNYPILAIL